LLWLHVISDVLIFLAYFSIPVAIIYIVKKRKDLAFGWLFYLFGAFILCCGITHIFSVYNIWVPEFYSSGIIKAITAFVSVLTAVLLWPLIPKVLQIPSIADIRDKNNALVREREMREQYYGQLLRTKEENLGRMAAIFNASIDAIVVFNKEGNIVDVNPSAERLFVQSASNLRNTEFLDLFLENLELDETLDDFLVRVPPNAESFMYRLKQIGRQSNGEQFPCELTMSRYTEDGESVNVVYIRDLTEEEHLNKYKREFVSTVSHELRTPLTSLLGSLKLINSNIVSKEQVNSLMDIALSNGERLLTLINDILHIDKLMSKKYEYNKSTFKMHELAAEAVHQCQGLMEKYNIQFEFTANTKNSNIYADRDRILQVVVNLLSNAAKFAPQNITQNVWDLGFIAVLFPSWRR